MSEDSTPESKHVTKFKESHLESDDKVVTSVEGYIGDMMGKGDNTQHNGALIVTSKQVAFYRKGLLGEILETIPLKSITSIERRPTLRHCTIRIHTSHDDLTFKTLDKEQEAIVVKAIEDGRAIEPVSQTAPAPQNGLDTLRELNELKELGIITEEEFNAKKQTILAAI
ncbi:hypothetical protein AB835_12415 [Candidatus Endobugula sertula]|uniref:YokE-like PH domain-containing protein n=1 Tax=Candidatus Endobugula sertula TaxID=62101 RepID=A0A1D2QMJ3_9GAMM|nr:hypothetical protein AB835_12415 [Candidatus Endobugula sertula]